MWADGFIAVDWGTTNRRAYRLAGSAEPEAEFEDGKGILSVPAGGFPAAIAEIRDRLGDRPLLLAGMIGSNRGWVEAPYVGCPAAIDDLAGGLMRAGGRELIVPGVSYLGEGRADVMRGEEVQLLGAVAAGLVPADALVCHPGTHNKWAVLAGGRIMAFRTVMTGELYSLLKEHSILADLLGPDVEPGEAFSRGVRHGLDHADLPSELFQVRARVLLGQAGRDGAASYVSGMLIGSDLRIGMGEGDSPVVVMGRAELTELYAAALREAGRKPVEVDGERCFLAGAVEIAKRISR